MARKVASEMLETELAESVGEAEIIDVVESDSETRLTIESKSLPQFGQKCEISIIPDPTQHPEDHNQWIAQLQSHYALITALSHPLIVNVYELQLNRRETCCEILLEYGGVSLDKLKGPKTGALCMQLLRQSLDVCAHIERCGYSLLSLTMASVLYNSSTNCFKMSDKIIEWLVPRWLPPNSFDFIESVEREYAAPELAFFVSGCDGAILSKKPCISDETPELDLGAQDVYSWGLLIYCYIASEGWTWPPIGNPVEYSKWLQGIDAIRFADDPTGETLKGLRPLLKAALNYKPEDRPSFYSLYTVCKAAQRLSEEAIAAKLASRCQVCGHIPKKQRPVCSCCALVHEVVTNERPAEILKQKLHKRLEKEPYAVVASISKLKAGAGTTKPWDWEGLMAQIKALDHIGKNELLVAALYSCFVVSLKAGFYTSANTLALDLLNALDDVPLVEPLSTLMMYGHLMDLMLPVSSLVCPNAFTIPDVRPVSVPLATYKTKLCDACQRISSKGIDVSESCERRSYAWLYFQVQDIRNSNLEYAHQTVRSDLEEMPKNLKYAVKYWALLKGYPVLCLWERMFRIAMELNLNNDLGVVASEIFTLASKHYDQQDCREFSYVTQALASQLKAHFENAIRLWTQYFESSHREGNVANLLLGHNYLAIALLKTNKLGAGLEHFKASLQIPITREEHRELQTMTVLYIAEVLIEQQKYKEAYDYAKRCCEYVAGHSGLSEVLAKALLYYSCTQRAMKLESEAEKSLDSAVAAVLKANFKNEAIKAQVLLEAGNTQYRKKDYKKALKYYGTALRTCTHIHKEAHKNLLIKIHLNYANTLRAQGNWQNCKTIYKENMQLLTDDGKEGSITLARLNTNLATLYLQINNQEKAIMHLDQAKKILTRMHMTSTALYKDVVQLSSQIPTTHLQMDDFGPQSRQQEYISDVDRHVISAEEETIREIIILTQRQFSREVIHSLCTLGPLLQELVRIHAAPAKISTQTQEYMTNIAQNEQAQLILSCLGFTLEGKNMVAQKPNFELFTNIANFMKSY